MIKRYVLDRVARGTWQEGDRVPSESDLVRLFGVSRMTAHRALRELASERVLPAPFARLTHPGERHRFTGQL